MSEKPTVDFAALDETGSIRTDLRITTLKDGKVRISMHKYPDVTPRPFGQSIDVDLYPEQFHQLLKVLLEGGYLL